jgi:hypothetical protein
MPSGAKGRATMARATSGTLASPRARGLTPAAQTPGEPALDRHGGSVST